MSSRSPLGIALLMIGVVASVASMEGDESDFREPRASIRPTPFVLDAEYPVVELSATFRIDTELLDPNSEIDPNWQIELHPAGDAEFALTATYPDGTTSESSSERSFNGRSENACGERECLVTCRGESCLGTATVRVELLDLAGDEPVVVDWSASLGGVSPGLHQTGALTATEISSSDGSPRVDLEPEGLKLDNRGQPLPGRQVVDVAIDEPAAPNGGLLIQLFGWNDVVSLIEIDGEVSNVYDQVELEESSLLPLPERCYLDACSFEVSWTPTFRNAQLSRVTTFGPRYVALSGVPTSEIEIASRSETVGSLAIESEVWLSTDPETDTQLLITVYLEQSYNGPVYARVQNFSFRETGRTIGVDRELRELECSDRICTTAIPIPSQPNDGSDVVAANVTVAAWFLFSSEAPPGASLAASIE